MVVLGGCAADPEAPQPARQAEPELDIKVMSSGADTVDICGLAAALPADDICSLACDPDAMKAQMIADGNETGTCYQLYCSLTDTQHVLVGVCLPP